MALNKQQQTQTYIKHTQNKQQKKTQVFFCKQLTKNCISSVCGFLVRGIGEGTESQNGVQNNSKMTRWRKVTNR
jgi:hypothetical protein